MSNKDQHGGQMDFHAASYMLLVSLSEWDVVYMLLWIT